MIIGNSNEQQGILNQKMVEVKIKNQIGLLITKKFLKMGHLVKKLLNRFQHTIITILLETRIKMIKNCIHCGGEFHITKHQRTKQYCSDLCKPTFKPNYGKAIGRPKKKSVGCPGVSL